jgi:hypothetical protein
MLAFGSNLKRGIFFVNGFRFGRRRLLEYDRAFSYRTPLAGLATDDNPFATWGTENAETATALGYISVILCALCGEKSVFP